MTNKINTRILVLSDTHGANVNPGSYGSIDLVIHCGDLTEGSKLEEYQHTIDMLKRIPASNKIIIAGNHDFTLDDDAFQQILQESNLSLDDGKVKAAYGELGEARSLIEQSGIKLLDEGTHQLSLGNGAAVTVYASPYTPSKEGPNSMGFRYHPDSGHVWDIPTDADIVITHGPPKGIFDYTDSKERIGDPDLFSAVARVKPLMHCFGHVHSQWGARKVRWRENVGERPNQFTAIDNSNGSRWIEKADSLRPREFDCEGALAEKASIWQEYREAGYCAADMLGELNLVKGRETLFVNAAIQGPNDDITQVPWLVELELARAADA